MRWADLDELGHVNNVVYLSYADEALAAHVAAGELDEAPTRAASVEFLRPLLLSRTPVTVRSRLDGDTLVQHLHADASGEPCATVTTVRGAPEPLHAAADAAIDGGAHYLVHVRREDLGVGGAATLTKIFEYAQEARISTMAGLRDVQAPGERVVVARVDVRLGRPFRWHGGPYPARTVVNRVGRSSFAASTSFDDGLHGTAEAVLVGFDPTTQRSRPFTDAERRVLGA